MKRKRKAAMLSLLAVLTVFAGLWVYGLRFAVVNGESMEPSVRDGSIVFYREYNFEPSLGDVVLLRLGDREEQKIIIKRVIGIAGDSISSRYGKLYVNGKREEDRYGVGRVDCEDITVPEGSIFVLGDNRTHSYDSRDFGTVKLEDVLGKVL